MKLNELLVEELTVLKLAIPVSAKALRALPADQIKAAVDGFRESQTFLTLDNEVEVRGKVVRFAPYWSEHKKVTPNTPNLVKQFKAAFEAWCYEFKA